MFKPKIEIEAPEYYWKLPQEFKDNLQKEHFLFKMHPIIFNFSKLKEIITIHAYMYDIGKTTKDRIIADKILERNLKKLKLNSFIYKLFLNIINKNIIKTVLIYGEYYFDFTDIPEFNKRKI